MARRSDWDADVDHLYQMPLAEFVAERNALAKGAGPRAAEIRALQKPSLPAWAINQLYWQDRKTYDELVQRAADLRATHTAAARGRQADVRGASRAHEEATDRALKRTLALLADSGQPITDATRQAVATTLRGLPSDEAPGRLTRQLQPRGFEMLTGAPSPGRVRIASAPKPKETKRRDLTAQEREQQLARTAAAREAAAAAAREAREAEQTARREEFEAARAAREAEKALRQAEHELGEARRAAEAAVKDRDQTEARATKAHDRAATAREREEAARRQLDSLA